MEMTARSPRLAIIGNCPSPYRTRQHLRYVEELPGLDLASVFLYERSAHAWDNPLPPEINPVLLAPGSSIVGRHRPRGLALQVRNTRRVLRWLRGHQPAVVMVTGFADLALLATMAWCRARSVPYILYSDSNVAGDRARGGPALAKWVVLSLAVRGAAVVGVAGRAGLRYFYRYGARSRPVVFLPPEPDYEPIASLTEREIAGAAADLKLRPGRRRFLLAGRLSPEKGVDLLVRAFASVAVDLPDWDLVVAGDGPQREALMAAVPSSVRSRITWTGFVAGRRELGAVYRSCDVLVVPSTYEPWGVVVLEAAAAGLALVVSDVVGAALELVVTGDNGRTFRTGDEDDLRAALLSVAPAAEAMGARSRLILADWHHRSDPVRGLQVALERCGVELPEGAASAT